jgi:hypothetical protein
MLLYSKMKTEGSRAEVMHGTAKRTSGGLKKSDLKYNKWGSIVSRKKSSLARSQKHLEKAGWTAKKGKFGAVCMKKKCKTAKKGRGRRGIKKGGGMFDEVLGKLTGGETAAAANGNGNGTKTEPAAANGNGTKTETNAGGNGAGNSSKQEGGRRKKRGRKTKGHGRK